MTKRSTSLLIAMSVVIIGAIVFFKSSNNGPTSTDVSGAIGTVEKYRSEQITPSDVVLDSPGISAEEFYALITSDNATLESLGNLFGRLSAQERVNLYGKMTPEMTSAVLDRAPEIERTNLMGRATPEQVTAAFERFSIEERTSLLGKGNFTVADYERANLQGRSDMLGRLTGGLAAIYQRTTPQERVDMLGRASVEERTSLIGRATVTEKSSFIQSAPEAQRADVFERAFIGGRSTAGMERTSIEQKAN